MSDSSHPFPRRMIKGVRLLFSALFFMIGATAFMQGISCLYGGPDGQIFSRMALQYGGFFLLLWLGCGGVFLALQHRSRTARRWFLITHEALLLLYWLAMIPAIIRSGIPEAFALQSGLLVVLASGGYYILRTGRKNGVPDDGETRGAQKSLTDEADGHDFARTFTGTNALSRETGAVMNPADSDDR